MQERKEKAANAIFDRVLKQIKPSEAELRESVSHINMLMRRLGKVLPKDVEARVVGSVVRGTQLRGDSDIDIFLLFNKKHSRDKITKDGMKYAKAIVNGKRERYEIKYAEHPYVRVHLDDLGVKADIVPAFKIDNIEDMGTAVDRSPMHADFVNRHLSKKQRDEVRLLKRLLDAHGIYGAEIATGGFSGYLCELLIYHYGSLIGLLEGAADLRLPLVLHPKTKAVLDDAGLVKRFNSQFIVIDPIDKDRNVAAAVSPESLARFVSVARNFIEKPSAGAFAVKGFAPAKAASLIKSFSARSGLGMFVIETKVPDKTEDIIWPQLRKVAEFIKAYAEKFSFRVYFSIPVVKGRKGLMVFIAPKESIKTRIVHGPSILMRKAAKEFYSKHKGAIGLTIIEDRICAIEPNKHATIEDALKAAASGKVLRSHKDISMSGARLHSSVPKEYAAAVYAELLKRISA